MDLYKINPKSIWYHGSNMRFSLLRVGSTVTLDRALAEAFSHKPPLLSCEEDGTILHNGRKRGVLYIIDEPVDAAKDLIAHPRTTLAPGAEFLTRRPLLVRMIAELGRPNRAARKKMKRRWKERVKKCG